MATVIGLMETAKGYLPDFGGRKRRAGQDRANQEKSALPTLRPAQRQAPVADLIEHQIIPRLMVAHRDFDIHITPVEGQASRITAAEAMEFAPLALELEADVLLNEVEVFLRRGASIDTVFVDLLAPAARRLGVLWEDDLCDFVDVTMGLWRLQEIVRELSSRVPERIVGDNEAARALFATMPGEDHSFGTVIVEDMFRRDGWETDLMSACTTPDLLDRVARQPLDLVGLTVSTDAHIGRLPSLILALRSVSRNPRLCIMLGGRIFVANPELAGEVGGDGTAIDAIQALDVAKRLVDASTCREVAGT